VNDLDRGPMLFANP